MRLEEDIIPYQPSFIPDGPWLVFSPHPDDETFGMGGVLRLGVIKGVAIRVIFVTSGDKGGDPLLREREAFEAMDILGVSRDSLLFWRFPDRELCRYTKAISRLIYRFLAGYTPRTVFVPSPMEIHPDHRVVSKTVYTTLKRMGFKGDLWFYEVSRQSEANKLIVIDGVLNEKVRAMKAYRSQLALKPYMDIALSINRARALTLEGVSTVEAFFGVSLQERIPVSFRGYLLDTPPRSLWDRVLEKVLWRYFI